MNIIEMIERVKSYNDIVASSRHDWVAYETNLNTAVNQVVNDRVDAVKKPKQNKNYSFQSIQRLRDELYTLVVPKYNIVPTGDIIAIGSYPTNLRFIVGVRLVIDSNTYTAEALSYNEERDMQRDPYTKPQLTDPYRVFYIESNTGLTCYYGDSGTFTASKIDYIKVPAKVNVGIRWTAADLHNFVVGDIIIATEPTVYNGISYDPGELITIVVATLVITSGEVVIGYTNSDLPEVLHEEVCKIAAGLFEKTVEDYNKGTILEREAEK
jgi:hypothetical protein